jgi:glc operon protein GlcG
LSIRRKITHVGLTLTEAEACISRVLAKARALGIEISVAIVDEHGHLKALARMDGAGWLTPDIAANKAFTAVAFRSSSSEVAERLKDNPNLASSLSTLSRGRLVPGAGGVLLEKDNEVIGALGVSGAPGKDEECASAGLFDNSTTKM